jgi:SAM-dependent methyltransferase
MSWIAGFARANSRVAMWIDNLVPFPPVSTGSLKTHDPRAMFIEATSIADIGGGKKPYSVAAELETDGKIYVGLDLDVAELEAAPSGTYSAIKLIDICAPDISLAGKFDLIICRSTLEHVFDTSAAIAGLALLLAPGGRCYLKLPCRKAAFARLNLLLPNEIKRRIMYAVFPHKQGDGFPAFYNLCQPSDISRLSKENDLDILAEKRNYRSSYFSFFFPLYVLWRLIATVQYLVDKDYCENFEFVFEKRRH